MYHQVTNKHQESQSDSDSEKTRFEVCIKTMSHSTEESIEEMETTLAESLVNMNSGNVFVSNTCNSLDVSGIQNLNGSSTPINSENIESPSILKEISAFVDDGGTDKGTFLYLINLGLKVEKTFNSKVTHVVFSNGYYYTYKNAIDRKIPLVSTRWVEKCILYNKILDPVDYIPEGIEKYAKLYERKRNDLRKSKRIISIKEKQLIDDSAKKEKKNENLQKPITRKSTDIIDVLKKPIKDYLKKKENKIEKSLLKSIGPPLAFKTLRFFIARNGIRNTSITEINTKLVKFEDSLKLNSRMRRKLRKLLFPLNKELLSMSINSNVSVSSQTSRDNSLSNLTGIEKQIDVLDIHTQNDTIGNSTISPQTNDTVSSSEVVQSLECTGLSELYNYTISPQTNDTVYNSEVVQSLACTGLSKLKINVIKLCLKRMGSFNYHNTVRRSTTHLVTSNKYEITDINMVSAMAFGCYIISDEWVLQSLSVGQWLPQEKYLITKLSKPVKEFQRRRHTIGGPRLKFNIFKDVGKIYISDSCLSFKKLKELVISCGGRCTNYTNNASVVIGINNVQDRWIIDCIIKGKLLATSPYKLNNVNLQK